MSQPKSNLDPHTVAFVQTWKYWVHQVFTLTKTEIKKNTDFWKPPPWDIIKSIFQTQKWINQNALESDRHVLPQRNFRHNDINSYVYNFPKDAKHAQCKHALAVFIHDVTPAHTTELSRQTRHRVDRKEPGCDRSSQALASLDLPRLQLQERINAACRSPANQCVFLAHSNDNKIYFSFYSLLCTVDELVFIGSLKARLHSFVVPQLLRVIKELLSRRDTK